MNERDLTKQDKRRLERDLFKAGKARAEDIEKIVAAPHLFNLVRARIENEKSRRAEKRGFPAFSDLGVWKWHAAAAGFVFMAILLSALLIFAPKKSSPAIENARNPLPESEAKKENPEKFIKPPRDGINEPGTSKATTARLPKQLIAARKSLPKKTEKRAVKAKRLQRPGIEPEKVESGFIPLTYAGNVADDEQRIVRVELPPSRLLSLGIPVHTENETEKIKTDLLVGMDGIARAIRLVR